MQLETVAFVNRAPDFAWALLFSCAVLLASTVVLPNYFLSSALIAVLLYLWSRENQAARVSFFGLFTVDGFYLPWVMVGWTLVSGGSPIEELRGIMAAHIYWFLATGWPRAGGPQGLMATPELVRQFIGWAFGCVTHSQRSIHFGKSILHPRPCNILASAGDIRQCRPLSRGNRDLRQGQQRRRRLGAARSKEGAGA